MSGFIPVSPELVVDESQFSIQEGNQGAELNNKGFYFQRQGDLSSPSSFDYQVTQTNFSSYGNADVGVDLPASAGTVSFAPNVSTVQLLLPVSGDTTFEPNEHFYLAISNFQNLTSSYQYFDVVLLNDDASQTPASLTVDSYGPAAEADSGGLTPARFTLRRSGGDLNEEASVFWGTSYFAPSLSGSRAALGVDFELVNYERVDFASGQQTADLVVNIYGDDSIEGTEVFSLTLRDPVNLLFYGASVDPWSLHVSIADNDFVRYSTAAASSPSRSSLTVDQVLDSIRAKAVDWGAVAYREVGADVFAKLDPELVRLDQLTPLAIEEISENPLASAFFGFKVLDASLGVFKGSDGKIDTVIAGGLSGSSLPVFGGIGKDLFVAKPGAAVLQIMDFNPMEDVVMVDGAENASFVATEQGFGVEVSGVSVLEIAGFASSSFGIDGGRLVFIGDGSL